MSAPATTKNVSTEIKVLLQDAQQLRTILFAPWLMIPVLPVIIFILAFNFVGDGLRDAADPYKS
jgi:peptide/nickel transport system permease protein